MQDETAGECSWIAVTVEQKDVEMYKLVVLQAML